MAGAAQSDIRTVWMTAFTASRGGWCGQVVVPIPSLREPGRY